MFVASPQNSLTWKHSAVPLNFQKQTLWSGVGKKNKKKTKKNSVPNAAHVGRNSHKWTGDPVYKINGAE